MPEFFPNEKRKKYRRRWGEVNRSLSVLLVKAKCIEVKRVFKIWPKGHSRF